jgi:hypothetical protein
MRWADNTHLLFLCNRHESFRGGFFLWKSGGIAFCFIKARFMKQFILPLLLTALFAAGCQPQDLNNSTLTVVPESGIIVPDGKTIGTRFNPPPGYHRLPANAGSYTAFLRSLALKPHGALVHYYNGEVKENGGVYAAVLDLDVGNKDLQQCADAVMRLRAEYLFAVGQPDNIKFHLTNGFLADFAKWSQGYRVALAGNNTSWQKTALAASDHKTLRSYLDFVYAYAGSLSLSKELRPVVWADMQPGDVLIIGGSPGHAETVMDMAEDELGHKVFLLSQSYMPAQDIQVLENPSNVDTSPWYSLKDAPYTVRTPQYDFTTADLKRW